MIDMSPHEADISIVRRAHDRLTTNIEAGIHEDRATCPRLERFDEVVIIRIRLARHGLYAC